MVKIVGKSLILFCVISFFTSFFITEIYCVSLKLRAVSTDGFNLKEAQVARPFILEVDIGDSSNMDQPEIAGIQDFYTGQTGFKMSTVNGRSSIVHTFYVRIDEPGEYRVGPAYLKDKGKVYHSNKLKLKVSDDQVLKNDDDVKKPLDEKVFFSIHADNEHVVIGEKINCVARFCLLDEQNITQKIILRNIVKSEVEDLKEVATKGTFRQKIKINGDIYTCIEYRWAMLPKKAGSITLPAYRADFDVQSDDDFGGFAAFWSGLYKRKYIYSNPLTFDVRPLPQYDGVVDAVGQFESFNAFADRAVAKQGDGIVITLEIEGSGDFENLDIKELKDMPKSLKYYNSKQYISDSSPKDGMKKKRFEFIVQGMASGEFEIPGQTFTFFDVQSRDYKILKTSPILLKILPNVLHGVKSHAHNGDAGDASDVSNTPDNVVDNIPNKQNSKQNNKKKDDIKPIQTYGQLRKVQEREIPFWIFILLVITPLSTS